MAPWETKHFHERVSRSDGASYLRWLLEESGRYDDFELKSQYVKRRIYSVAEHCVATMIHDEVSFYESHAEAVHNWLEMRGSYSQQRQLLLLLCP